MPCTLIVDNYKNNDNDDEEEDEDIFKKKLIMKTMISFFNICISKHWQVLPDHKVGYIVPPQNA